jgi:hypothetical protein
VSAAWPKTFMQSSRHLEVLKTGATPRVSVDSAGVQGNFNSRRPSISANGRFVAFDSDADKLVAGDTDGFTDVFVHDTKTNSYHFIIKSRAGPPTPPMKC